MRIAPFQRGGSTGPIQMTPHARAWLFLGTGRGTRKLEEPGQSASLVIRFRPVSLQALCLVEVFFGLSLVPLCALQYFLHARLAFFAMVG